MKLEVLSELNAERAARRGTLLATDMKTGEQSLIRLEEVGQGPWSDLLRERFAKRKSGLVEWEGRHVFLAVQAPPVRIIIVGAVHISQVLAPILRALEFNVTIIDPRTAFATTERFPDGPVLADWPDVALPRIGLDRYTALAVLTHDPKIDDPALAAALRSSCFYIGALGSRKTHQRRVERLTGDGFGETEIARIHAPIGLDIGATSPSEIAVSIAAEIVSALRTGGRDGA